VHAAAYTFVREMAPRRPRGPVLEIGGRNVNGTIRDLFDGDPYTAIDLRPGPGVDLVADGLTYRPPTPPACVVCCEVLEHMERPDLLCAHVREILAPGGLFLLTAAGYGRAPHSGIDGGPRLAGEHYLNIGLEELAGWLARFASLALVDAPATHDVYAAAWKGTEA